MPKKLFKDAKERAQQKKLVKEAIERRVCGPVFGHNDTHIFRMAVGSFFTVKTIGEFQDYIEQEAEKVLKAAEKAFDEREKPCQKNKKRSSSKYSSKKSRSTRLSSRLPTRNPRNAGPPKR